MDEASTSKPRARRLVRWLLIAFVALPFLVIGCCYAVSSGVALAEGGFTPKQVYSFAAPDGHSILAVTKRIAFPANEFVDPSIVVTVEIREARTNRVIARERLTLEEDSDLREPTVEWTPDVVRLRGIDSRYARIITIPRNA